MKLYYAPGACSFVPHCVLELAGATFEPVLVKLHKGEQQTPDYLALNPRGQVPVLVDTGPDGSDVITQITAIVQHLDARFPEAGVLPPPGLARTRFLETLAWMNNTVHPTFTHIFMPQKFTDQPEAQQAIRAHAVGQYRTLLQELESLCTRAAAAHAAGALPGALPWLSGAHPGALDAYALTFMRWGSMVGIDPAQFPALWALAQRLVLVPAVARVVERERLQLNLYRPAEA